MTFVLISVACFVSIILAMRWLSHKPELRLHLEIQRLLSVFHLVLAAAVPVDMHHSMQISDFRFQISIFFIFCTISRSWLQQKNHNTLQKYEKIKQQSHKSSKVKCAQWPTRLTVVDN